MSYVDVDPDDGTQTVTHRASEWVRSLPTYGQWKLWLTLTRKVRDGRQETSTEGRFLKDDGTVAFVCIGCGAVIEGGFHSLTRIVIGSLVRKENESTSWSSGSKIVEKTTKPQPVSKAGYGCVDCLGKFTLEQARTIERYTAENAEWNIRARLATLTGIPNEMKIPRPLRERTSFIRMFQDPQCGACGDTLHLWNKEAGKYVRCTECPQ